MPMYFCFFSRLYQQGISLVGRGWDRYVFNSVPAISRRKLFPGAAKLDTRTAILRERHIWGLEFNNLVAFVVCEDFCFIRRQIASIIKRPIIFKGQAIPFIKTGVCVCCWLIGVGICGGVGVGLALGVAVAVGVGVEVGGVATGV